jgi:two-component system response regulator FlrC
MRLLLIGSLDGQIGAAAQIALKRGAKVNQADTVDRGLDMLRTGQGADLVMIDVRQSVRTLTEALKAERIAVPVVACGTAADTQAAVDAIKAGAKEYVPLPPDAELIAAVLAAVVEEDHAIVFRDPRMAEVIRLADQIAPSDASVLIVGPSGTGKELLARHLHAKSPRKNRNFVAVNCAAIPENLLESELFGHEKGAFTGAVARRLGRFEEANGGTLLLDEISEMDLRLQAKLLRAVQEREIDRVGGNRPVAVDVRILATSNRDLPKEVAAGRFREDLYFRLNVITLALPPLAERPQDIEFLADYFVKKFAQLNGVKPLPLSVEARARLKSHSWPGNVRELENCIHRAVLLASGTEISADAVMVNPSSSAATSAAAGASGLVGRTVSDVERELIINTLTHCLGNRTHAATILRISIRTLRNKLKEYSAGGFAVPLPGEGSPAAT